MDARAVLPACVLRPALSKQADIPWGLEVMPSSGQTPFSVYERSIVRVSYGCSMCAVGAVTQSMMRFKLESHSGIQIQT